ncbi:MAG: multicopper oxidase domain-containing protein [Ardenticatenaceae bacterium]|nr:multicopper oxidase domain-containing protein [Ardenticatenaceae bacterium]HBY97888.1 copper oxidase [Chloroflexota bacterium]
MFSRFVLSRRTLLKAGALGSAASGLAAVLGQHAPALAEGPDDSHNTHAGHSGAGGNHTVGQVDHARNGFTPGQLLTEFDPGRVSTLPDGRTLREFTMFAADKEIEIAPGIYFPAWTYNGRVPGPTLRATEGDRVRITFTNAGSHPHTIHFHGIHTAEMDGVPGIGPGEVAPDQTIVYEFDAVPFGFHPYHCHAIPLKRHIHKGLYGAWIVDPKERRPPARELVMTMNAFDTNFDGENEVYAVNSIAFAYANEPIQVRVGELVRVYLANMTEFDPINSFHIHANFFHLYRTGTRLEPDDYTDTVMLCQGERAILEMQFPYPGKYMFHAHQSEFAELGWMSFFEVVEGEQ